MLKTQVDVVSRTEKSVQTAAFDEDTIFKANNYRV